MSLTVQNEFQCPRCSKLCSANVWASINVESDPDARDKILDGTFFLYTCPECGYEARLIYNTMYLDQERRQMIYLIEGDTESVAASEAEALQAAEDVPFWKGGNYTLRIVHSANDLREKLLIFDAGLDDRIVEICKGVALSQLPEGTYVTEIHFAVISGQQVLVLIDNEGEEQYVVDFPTLYGKMLAEYGEAVSSLPADSFECIDLEYAGALLRCIDKKLDAVTGGTPVQEENI